MAVETMRLLDPHLTTGDEERAEFVTHLGSPSGIAPPLTRLGPAAAELDPPEDPPCTTETW